MRVARAAAAASVLSLALAGGACGYSDPYVAGGSPAGVSTNAPTPVPGSSAPASAGGDVFSTGADKTPTTYPDGLKLTDVKVGTGAVVKKGDAISVQYTGWLANGTKFDSSRDRGQAFDLTIGGGQVIPGWDEGVPSMKVGGVRRLVIPPALGYGSQGAGSTIPPNSTLVFLIEVVADNGPAPSPSPS